MYVSAIRPTMLQLTFGLQIFTKCWLQCLDSASPTIS